MPIPPHHFLAKMSGPIIDDPLIDSLRRAIGTEGMPEHVPAAEFLPLRSGMRSLEMVVRFIRVKGTILSDRRRLRGMSVG
jgi:hypothetical protein